MPLLMMPQRARWMGWLVTLTAGVTAFAACADTDAARGQLVVPFVLGNGRTCGDLGIETVEADLDEGFFVEMTDCADGQVSLQDVPIGAYNVVLVGRDKLGVPVLDSAAGDSVRVDVLPGISTTIEPDVLLTAAPARLFLRWGFDFSDCETEGIDHFVVRAWHMDGSRLLSEHTLACDMPGEGSGRYRTVEDLERTLVGDVFGQVSVQPSDDQGRAIGESLSFTFEPPGPGYPVYLSLTDCASSGCESSGKLDKFP